MQLTLREALSIEPLSRSTIIAGEKGLDNIVKCVSVMEVPDVKTYSKEGELLITTLYPIHNNKEKQKVLISQLAEKKLAGIGIKLHRYVEEIPKVMIDEGNRLNFPILELHGVESFIDLILPVTSRILELKTNELMKSEFIHRQFMNLILNGGGYSEIANALTHLVKCPIWIVDQFGRVLAQSYVFSGAANHQEYLERDSKGDCFLSASYNAKVFKEIPDSEVKQMQIINKNEMVEFLACPIRTGVFDLGQIIVWGSKCCTDTVELNAIEYAATITALKIEEGRAVCRVEQRFSNEILEGLLSNKRQVQDQALRTALRTEKKFNCPYLLILVNSDTPHSEVRSLAEQNKIDESLYYAKRYIRSINPNCVFWEQSPRMTVFFSFSSSKVPCEKEMVIEEFRKICASLKQQFPRHTVSMGISKVHHNIYDFPQAYYCAVQSLELGIATSKGTTGNVFSYDELGILQVISPGNGITKLDNFCNDALGKLIDYDREHNSELLITLKVFFEHNQNAIKTAKALFIHYNTLRYRLETIEKLLGNVTKNPQKRLATEVALQIYPLVTNNSELV